MSLLSMRHGPAEAPAPTSLPGLPKPGEDGGSRTIPLVDFKPEDSLRWVKAIAKRYPNWATVEVTSNAPGPAMARVAPGRSQELQIDPDAPDARVNAYLKRLARHAVVQRDYDRVVVRSAPASLVLAQRLIAARLKVPTFDIDVRMLVVDGRTHAVAISGLPIAATRDSLMSVLNELALPPELGGIGGPSWRPYLDSTSGQAILSHALDPLLQVELVVEGIESWSKGVRIGITEDGTPYYLPLVASVMAGQPGAGKGSWLWNMVLNLGERAMAHGDVVVSIVDAKSGAEASAGVKDGVWWRCATTLAAAADQLEEAVRIMDVRLESMAAAQIRLHTPTPDEPGIVILIDEAAAILAASYAPTPAAKEQVKRCRTALNLLISKGRAACVSVTMFLQDPASDVLGELRRLARVKVMGRYASVPIIDGVLGTSAHANGARCDAIPLSLPGTAYAIDDEGSGLPFRWRAPYVSDERIRQFARERGPYMRTVGQRFDGWLARHGHNIPSLSAGSVAAPQAATASWSPGMTMAPAAGFGTSVAAPSLNLSDWDLDAVAHPAPAGPAFDDRTKGVVVQPGGVIELTDAEWDLD